MPLDNAGGGPLPSEEEQEKIVRAWNLLREACRHDRGLVLVTVAAFLEQTLRNVSDPEEALWQVVNQLVERLGIHVED